LGVSQDLIKTVPSDSDRDSNLETRKDYDLVRFSYFLRPLLLSPWPSESELIAYSTAGNWVCSFLHSQLDLDSDANSLAPIRGIPQPLVNVTVTKEVFHMSESLMKSKGTL
jgi:hypothetical protein